MADLREPSEQDIAYASALIETPYWRDYLQPRISQKCFEMLNSLAGGTSTQSDLERGFTDDVKRGWCKALTWVINLPKQEIDEHNQFKEEQQKEVEVTEEQSFRARYGNRSPYVKGGQPAEGE